MTYRPPDDIWDVSEQLQWDEPLPEEDPRYVKTERGRGDVGYKNRLLKTFGITSERIPNLKHFFTEQPQ